MTTVIDLYGPAAQDPKYATLRKALVATADEFVRDFIADHHRPGATKDWYRLSHAALVWPFDDAPAELRALSENGGDEDWLVLWPPGSVGARGEYVAWHDRLGPSTPDPDEYWLPCGAVVLISAHA